ncbi:protein of unknown function [Methylocaldum szegediense]|uniref:Uncharacterized protein n=1 Tax=Methylocaldum szegediense TaxID=73780 RepID=A0ABN8X9B5_9GAMM|nr:protein of unknown function [Methylocaldum szegediense]
MSSLFDEQSFQAVATGVVTPQFQPYVRDVFLSAYNLATRPVNTLLVFTGRCPGRYTPDLSSRDWSPRRGVPAPD